jgi:hypothetical protein
MFRKADPTSDMTLRQKANFEYERLKRRERIKIRAKWKKTLYKRARHFEQEMLKARAERDQLEILVKQYRARLKDG